MLGKNIIASGRRDESRADRNRETGLKARAPGWETHPAFPMAIAQFRSFLVAQGQLLAAFRVA